VYEGSTVGSGLNPLRTGLPDPVLPICGGSEQTGAAGAEGDASKSVLVLMVLACTSNALLSDSIRYKLIPSLKPQSDQDDTRRLKAESIARSAVRSFVWVHCWSVIRSDSVPATVTSQACALVATGAGRIPLLDCGLCSAPIAWY
jgi:hypothetical protein